jgi:PPOX class probable F420-dependent enzyme
MPTKFTEKQLALLSKPLFASVATVMADGSPQVTPVWVETDGEALLFNTDKARVKFRNLTRNPKVAVTVLDPEDPYRSLLVVRGRAEFVNADADAHLDRLAKKYLGKDRYPWRRPDDRRVIVRVIPEKVMAPMA